MTATRPHTLLRALVGVLSLGVVLTPALAPAAGNAATQDPKNRQVTAPSVFYPVRGTNAVKDQRTSTAKHAGTDITAGCNVAVYATHPGVAHAVTSKALGNYVSVTSNPGGLVTGYGYLSRVLIQPGQIMQSGQAIGYVGQKPGKSCELYFSVNRNGKRQNPTWWLNHYVGNTPPVPYLFGDKGFLIATQNMLGASHTVHSARFATGNTRLNRAMTMFNDRNLDVIGTQEFQETQFDYWTNHGYGNTYDTYYWNPAGKKRDTENLIMWRKSTMEFISGQTYDIPYFNGNTRHVPIVLLRERSSGRTVYVMNVHNPADVKGPAAKYRARGIAIEKQKIIDLRATGRPVLFTGDFNDHQKAFCPLTQNKLTITPNSIPALACAYPKPSSIDWIFAAGQVRFSSFGRDTYPQQANISDHPIVQARAHLQD
jgi:endonuclease/exonuclease/phosphatase family metal-dependent hydrolase